MSRRRIISDLIDDVEKKPADSRDNGRRTASLTDWVRLACVVEHYLYIMYILLYGGAAICP